MSLIGQIIVQGPSKVGGPKLTTQIAIANQFDANLTVLGVNAKVRAAYYRAHTLPWTQRSSWAMRFWNCSTARSPRAENLLGKLGFRSLGIHFQNIEDERRGRVWLIVRCGRKGQDRRRLVKHARYLLAAAGRRASHAGGDLATGFEGSRRCRSRTCSEPGETANRAVRSDAVGRSVSGQAGSTRETDPTGQRTCQTSRDATRVQLCRSELDTRGRQPCGFRAEIELKSEIPVNKRFVSLYRDPYTGGSARRALV
jgi:hypothetical protein